MNNQNNNRLLSQENFLEEHLHACEAPTEEGGRCSICLVEYTEDSASIVRIDLNHVRPCFYHRDCIVAWFGSVGQMRWSCPDHRIRLFVPMPVEDGEFEDGELEDGEINPERPTYLTDGIGGQLFAEDLSHELYIYAQAVMRRLKERERGGGASREEHFMFYHGIQRFHDLQLAAAMATRVNQDREFHALGRQIRELTESYDARFLEFMPAMAENILEQIATETGSDEEGRELVPDWWHAVLRRVQDQMNLRPRPAHVSIFLSEILMSISRIFYLIRLYQQQVAPGIGPNPLPGRVLAQDDREPPLAAMNAQAIVTPDGTAFCLDEIYESVQARVREHQLVNRRILEGQPVSATHLFVGYNASRERDLQLALFLSGYQYLNPEFLTWSQRLRECVRVADERFRNQVPGLIEENLRNLRNEVDSGRRFIEAEREARLLDLEEQWDGMLQYRYHAIRHLGGMHETLLDLEFEVQHFTREGPVEESVSRAEVERANAIRSVRGYEPDLSRFGSPERFDGEDYDPDNFLIEHFDPEAPRSRGSSRGR